MKVLLDTCVWGGARQEIERAGHEVEWVGEWSRDPGDEEILRRAHREGCVVVTIDKDFGELAVLHRQPHSGIVRLVGFRAGEMGSACVAALDRYAEELAAGALVTVETARVRVRPPEESS